MAPITTTKSSKGGKKLRRCGRAHAKYTESKIPSSYAGFYSSFSFNPAARTWAKNGAVQIR